MRFRRMVVAGLLLAVFVVPAEGAGAATRQRSGTMTGPGAFEPKGCGIISVVGHGTYTSTGLGQGTYVYDACVLSTSPFDFEGTVTFTRRTGATLTGTIDGTVPGATQPNFVVTVTGGTRRYAHAVGELMIGPLAESDPTNCDPRIGICLHWTDTGPVTGTLRHVRRHG